MLRTAVDVKNAIDSAPTRLRAIGQAKQAILEWKAENYGFEFAGEDEDVEDDERLLNQLNELKETLEGKYYTEYKFTADERSAKIRLGKYNVDLNISQTQLKEIYQEAEDSPFGDQENLETKIDKNVRDAKEISDIEVDPILIKRIEEEWSKNLYPNQVRVEPYKLNMYQANGKFKEHLDTPSKDLVGTALISSWGKDAHINNYLKISDINRKRAEYWQPREPSLILFYSDCPHEVSSYTEKNGNIRATIAFKIYAKDNSYNPLNEKFEKVKQALLPLLEDKKKGFILEHGYSLQTDSLKGSDSILASVLEQMGYKFILIPILYHFTLSSFHQGNNDDEFTSFIYPLREEEIDYLISSSKDNDKDNGIQEVPDFPHQDIEFYILNNNHYTWKNEHQSYCEYTGNESQPEEQNSIYLSRALIIL